MLFKKTWKKKSKFKIVFINFLWCASVLKTREFTGIFSAESNAIDRFSLRCFNIPQWSILFEKIWGKNKFGLLKVFIRTLFDVRQPGKYMSLQVFSVLNLMLLTICLHLLSMCLFLRKYGLKRRTSSCTLLLMCTNSWKGLICIYF